MNSTNWKVLVVDDDPEVLKTLKLAIAGWGFDVTVADNGAAASEILAHQPFSIVLADMQMPGMSGLSLLRRIRKKSLLTRFIMITGHGTIEQAVDAMKLGASEFILKPVDLQQLRIVLQKCIDIIVEQQANREMRRINSKLIELSELKEKFLNITSHELRTPLTVIRGYLEILKQQTALDQECRDMLSIVQRSTRQLDDTVNRLYDLSLCQAGKLPEAKEKTDVNSIAVEVVEEMQAFCDARKIDFRTQIETDMVLPIRENVLRTILRELLQNAIKFTPDQGLVKLWVTETAEHVSVQVSDSGIGIPYDKQEQIFTSFYEVQDSVNHHTSKEAFLGGGMGIGLSIVEEMVNHLNGKVHLVSHPGEGSKFTVDLPLPNRLIHPQLLRSSEA